jgi:hypothetical protein
MYENLLIKAKMTTKYIRRIRTMALETFKILNGLAPPVLSNLENLIVQKCEK